MIKIDVKETVNGITGNTLNMELTGNTGVDIDNLSALFNDVIMKESEYNELVTIWNLPASDSVASILKSLLKAGLIEGYTIK